jgi:hypothetical protein
MKDPAAQRIWHHRAWIVSIIHEKPLHIASDESTFLFFGATDRSRLLPVKSVLSRGVVVIMAVRNKV